MNYDNLLSLSTAAMVDTRPHRYLSAAHAVESFLELLALQDGCIALDYEKIGDAVQSQAAPENPHLEKLSEKWFLEGVIRRTLDFAGERRAEHWVRVRVRNEALRAFSGVSKSTIHRHVVEVDAFLEGLLYDSGRMVRSQVRGAV